MIEAIEYSQLIPSPPGNNEIMDSATTVLDNLLVTDELSPQEAADQIAEEINGILME